MGCQGKANYLNTLWHLQLILNTLPICINGFKYYESSPTPSSKIKTKTSCNPLMYSRSKKNLCCKMLSMPIITWRSYYVSDYRDWDYTAWSPYFESNNTVVH